MKPHDLLDRVNSQIERIATMTHEEMAAAIERAKAENESYFVVWPEVADRIVQLLRGPR